MDDTELKSTWNRMLNMLWDTNEAYGGALFNNMLHNYTAIRYYFN